MYTIETPRLRLRPFTIADVDIYAQWLADPVLMTKVGDGNTKTFAEAKKNLQLIITQFGEFGNGLYAVEEKDSSRLVGRVGLFKPMVWPGTELTWLLDKPYWGKGYATEAALGCIELAFQELDLDALVSLIRLDNKRSISMAQRLGMQKQQQTKIGDQITLVYELTKPNFINNFLEKTEQTH